MSHEPKLVASWPDDGPPKIVCDGNDIDPRPSAELLSSLIQERDALQEKVFDHERTIGRLNTEVHTWINKAEALDEERKQQVVVEGQVVMHARRQADTERDNWKAKAEKADELRLRAIEANFKLVREKNSLKIENQVLLNEKANLLEDLARLNRKLVRIREVLNQT